MFNITIKHSICSNIAHCYNKKTQYGESLRYSLLAVETLPTFSRAFERCAESFTHLNQHAMAALAIMKGTETCHPEGPSPDLVQQK